MSIKSHAFGRVTLTKKDAAEFKNQVTYGPPTAAAGESVKKGVKLSRAYQEDGKVEFSVKNRDA